MLWVCFNIKGRLSAKWIESLVNDKCENPTAAPTTNVRTKFFLGSMQLSALIFMLVLPTLVTTRRVEPRLVSLSITAIHHSTPTEQNAVVLFLHEMQGLVLCMLNQLQLVRNSWKP